MRLGLIIALAASVLLAVTAAPAAAQAVAQPGDIAGPTSRGPVPLGAALWYACADPDFGGPPPLACQVRPAAPLTSAEQAARYSQAFTAGFDRLTPENEFKMVWTHPEPDRYDFATADKLTAYAEARGMRVRGHTLVYASSSPYWLTNPATPWTRETLLAVMREHITTQVTHFRETFPGVVDEWDVVNEPTVDAGGRDPNLFERIIGPDWIEQAFRAARAADPDALLYLNEFAADVDNPRQRGTLALAHDLLAKGVPLDGIGLQMHVGADGSYPTLEALTATMARYQALGLRVAITELDALRPVRADGGTAQRAAYNTVAEACRQASNCTSVTVWGVADPYSWRSAGQAADLLDASFAPKPAYAEVRCRLADPRPLEGAWTPKPCSGAVLTEAGSAPVPPTSDPPAQTAPTPTVPTTPTTPIVPRPVSSKPAAVVRPSPFLRVTSVRRTSRSVRVSGTARASGRVEVSFRQVVRGRALRASTRATLRSGRFITTLRLTGALARVSRGQLTVRYAGSPSVRPAAASRTLRRPSSR